MNDIRFFFDGWDALARILVVGTATYVALIVLLRLAGQRTLSQLNAFDFIVTVAIGAVFGRVVTARDVTLAEALLAITLLVLLQFIVSSLVIRSPRFARLVQGDPVLLYANGKVLHAALRRERLTENDLLGAARQHGFASLEEVGAVVLEPPGKLSVLRSSEVRLDSSR